MNPLDSSWGHFEGEAVTRWIREDGADRRMELREALVFVRKNGERWEAKPGLQFDGASIPRALWSLSGSPFDGDYREAAIIHDQYCKDGRDGRCRWDSATVHQVFYEAMRALGVPGWRARIKWAAVRAFGPRFKGCPPTLNPRFKSLA